MDAYPLSVRRSPLLITLAALGPLAACAILQNFRDSVTAATSALILVLIVVAFAATGVRASGLIAAISSAAWFDFFLTEPYQTFSISDPDDVEVAVLLVIVGIAVTEIALWGRRQQARASRRAGYIDGALRVSALATGGDASPDTITGLVADEIVRLLSIDRARFVPDQALDPRRPHIQPDGSVTRDGRAIKVERDGLPTNDEIAIEVRHGDVPIGHYLLTASTRIARPTLEQRQVAVLLADQVVAARTRSASDVPPAH